MNCYGFKGGSGTASRAVDHAGDRYVVGAFVQANFGSREELTIAGVHLGH
jgi:L-aminopeptidase/D-esterase-like protein